MPCTSFPFSSDRIEVTTMELSFPFVTLRDTGIFMGYFGMMTSVDLSKTN